MKTISVNWTPPTPSMEHPIDGQVLRAYLDSGMFLEVDTLSASADSYQFECAEGELTVKVSAKSEAEESEPDSETAEVGGGSAPNLNPNIPQPSGVSIYVAP